MGGDRRLFLCANVSIQVQVYSTVTALTQTDLKSPNASADEITVYRYGFAYCFCFNSSESRLAYPPPAWRNDACRRKPLLVVWSGSQSSSWAYHSITKKITRMRPKRKSTGTLVHRRRWCDLWAENGQHLQIGVPRDNSSSSILIKLIYFEAQVL